MNGEDDNDPPYHQRIQNTHEYPSNKHIETRVTYQYPKGNFKFPVIPDRRLETVKKEKKEEQLPPSQIKSKKVIRPKPQASQGKKESVTPNKQPFRPTVIPSAVHGFRTPPIKPKETIVEYELPSNAQNIREAKSEAVREVAATVEVQEEPLITNDDIAENEKQVQKSVSPSFGLKQENEKEDATEARLQDTTTSSVSIVDILSELKDESPNHNDEIELPIEGIRLEAEKGDTVDEDQQDSTTSSINIVDILSELKDESPNHNQELELPTEGIRLEAEEGDSMEEDSKDSTTSSVNIDDLLSELQHGPLKESHKSETKPEDKQKEQHEEQQNHPNVNEQESVYDQEQDSKVENNTQVQEKPAQSTEGSRPISRPHIPFNVIMLKKDRQNLQKKNEKVEPEKPMLEPKETETERVVIKGTVSPQNQGVQSTNESEQTPNVSYEFPSLGNLHKQLERKDDDEQWLQDQQLLLDQALKNFKVRATVVNVTQGPAVTRFEVHPEPGVKVNKITNLADDIKLHLSAKEIRIEAPIPGKNTIGIEVPNKISKPVFLQEIVQSSEFIANESPLTVALGLDISGKPIVTDLKKMPHGLIAGATGSGKSVCINTMLVSLLYKAAPHEVKLLLIDPKMVELAPYNEIPHLVSPVITDVKAATAALKWAVEEMERRYELFAHSGVRDIHRYNEMVQKHQEPSGELPYLVIIIDELADLMMVAPGDVEEAICRIAQKARACGIHLILATQRPSVDVITGLIKANIPTRIAFSVSSQVDSRTIIDTSGAEKLLGKGDMLFLENGSSKPTRVQGNFVSDDEIEKVVAHVKSQAKPTYLFEQSELIKKSAVGTDDDELFTEACEFVFDQGGASTSSLQRRFRIGYNRAARLIDMMEEQGIISEARGSKPREVLISEEELSTIQES